MSGIFPDKIGGPEIINEKMCIINNEKIIKSFCVAKLTVSKFSSRFSQDERDRAAVANST